jgi:hypothetical protein
MKIKESMESSTIFGRVLSKSGAYRGNNAYFLEELNGESVGWGPVNASSSNTIW